MMRMHRCRMTFCLSVLWAAVWHCESTFDDKFVAKFIDGSRSKLAPIVREPFTDNATRQLVLPFLDKVLKTIFDFTRML